MLLAIYAHLHSDATLPERGACMQPKVVHKVHVMLYLARPSAETNSPRGVRCPTRKRHILDDTRAVDTHTQTLVAICHTDVQKSATSQLEPIAALCEKDVGMPYLQSLCSRQ